MYEISLKVFVHVLKQRHPRKLQFTFFHQKSLSTVTEDKPSSDGKMIGGKQVLSHSATLVPFGDNIINSKILCFCTCVCLTMDYFSVVQIIQIIVLT